MDLLFKPETLLQSSSFVLKMVTKINQVTNDECLQESAERVQGLLRVARQQDEKRHASQTVPAPAPVAAPARPPPQQQVNGIIGRTTVPPATNNYPSG